ncbi:CdaR family protein [Clostridium magnum]|uniref:YbbR-like protein n=1 Tax=Clostridium magnum DSM 2767 TaxID=1121326 RepID=A0A162TYW3_9CLOT|nr:CdaR family protein [Clostridium magnum]KZL93231.1 YbbR-like protein [Clostridium magnum DSM 2767]SHI19387.1 YbbR domain-containing protein [Clostridium magnum DSM 2767]
MEEKSKRQQVIIKVCCVIASFVLWLYIFNVENPVRERKLVVPVQMVNKDILAQSKLVPVGEENISITLDIRGNASDIYSVKPEDFKLESDLSAYVVKKGENRIPVEIKKSPGSIRIVNNENLWISINLDEIIQKTVSVKVIVEGKAKEGFYAEQPIIRTENVQITGPQQDANSVNRVVAICNIKDASKDINITASLKPEDSSGNIVKNVSVKPDSLQVIVPIKNIKGVPISVKTQGNLVNGGVLKSVVPSPEKIDISGEEEILSNINVLNTEIIDLGKLTENDTVEIKVLVPKGVTLVNSNGIVKVKINFDKGIQKTLSLDIKTINVGNNYSITMDNNKADLTISGLESTVNNLKIEDLSCFVDLNNLAEGEYDVPVTINVPDGISKVSQQPTSIKVTIKKTTGG